MQVNGIGRQLLDRLQFDLTPGPGAAASSSASKPESSTGEAPANISGRAFHEILSRYDVTNTTPREFSDLVQQLHDAGEIDDVEFRELARMRLELEQAGCAPDDTISLLDFFEQKLRNAVEDFESERRKASPEVAATLDESAATAEAKRQLEWVRKFALVQASGADAVDVGA